MYNKQTCNLNRGLVMCDGACETCDAYEALPLLSYEEAVKRTERDALFAALCRAGLAMNQAPGRKRKAG